jgi:hypothetical protein
MEMYVGMELFLTSTLDGDGGGGELHNPAAFSFGKEISILIE